MKTILQNWDFNNKEVNLIIRCSCGNIIEFQRANEGDTDCRCGRKYNLYGQELKTEEERNLDYE